MTDRYPGAIWRPIDYSGHKPCRELTAFTVHEAVTRAEQSVFGWVSSEGSCNWFNGKNGYAEQYIPAGIQSYANSDGNPRSFAMESYDGLLIHNDPSYWEEGIGGVYGDSAETGRWDAGQLERIADVFAWLNLEHGIPLRLMQTSHTSEHGIGPHRLGVPGWPTYDQNGGELWTSHRGKPCPGSLRIAQLPGIVARAQVIAAAIQAGKCSYLPTGNVDLASALARTGGKTSQPSGAGGPATPSKPTPEASDLLEEIMSLDRNSDDYKAFVADIANAVLDEQLPTPSGSSVPFTTLRRAVPLIQKDATNNAQLTQRVANKLSA